MQSNGTKLRTLIFASLLSLPTWAKDAKTASIQSIQKPLTFVENNGQIKDQDGDIRNDIQYRLSTPGMKLFVGNGELHYEFINTGKFSRTAKPDVKIYRTDVTLVGANPEAQVIATDKQAYYENYYQHSLSDVSDVITAHAYNKIIYKNVYPSIDWVLYVKDNKVEYDFDIHEGGNPNNIRIKYTGATSLKIGEKGQLVAVTPMGSIEENAPVAFETRSHKSVASKFLLDRDNVVRFQTGNYAGALTIDPFVNWSTYFGGTGEDGVNSVYVDVNGNIYATGYTASNAGIATARAQQTTFGGGTYDAFLVQYSPTGALNWATYFGGTGDDLAYGVTVDIANNVYITGSTTSAGGISGRGAYQAAIGGGQDAFLAQFSAGGRLFYSTYFGGPGNDIGYSVTTDAAGDIIIAGSTQSTSGIASGAAYQGVINGLTNGFIAKFNNTRRGIAIQWATYYGGNAEDEIYGAVCDADANIIVTGQASSAIDIATAGTYQTTLSGVNDAFVSSFSSAGRLNWGTYFGGPGSEQANGVAVDPGGNVYITGNTSSATNIATASAYQSVYGGGVQDAFLATFDNVGHQNWATYYGGNSADYGQGICVDEFNNIIIGGSTFSTNNIATSNGYQQTLAGDYDAFYAKFNIYGQNLYGSYFGGPFYDYCYSIATNAASNVIIGGTTSSTSAIASTGAAQTVYGGGFYDGFVTEFTVDTLVSIAQPYIDTIVCQGGTLVVNYNTNIAFQPGNTFNVELSDITGSFAARLVIGTATATISGSITCTIPAGTPAGIGYRIRIVSTAPNYTSPDDIKNIRVIPILPLPVLTGTTPICSGDSLKITDTTGYQVTAYSWTEPNGSSSTMSSISIFPATQVDSGIYFLTVAHNGCAPATSNISITVNSFFPPLPSMSSNGPICSDRTLDLFGSPGIPNPGFIYSWTGPNGFTSSLQNPTVADAVYSVNAGTYYLRDSLNDCASPLDSIVVVIMKDTPASISITPVPGDTVCYLDSIRFNTYTLNGGFDPLFQWYINNAPVTGASYSTYTSSGLITRSVIYCVLMSSITCPDNIYDTSNYITVDIINNTPVTTITATSDTNVSSGGSVTFTGYAVTYGTIIGYQWYVDGGAVAGATQDTFSISNITHGESVSMEAYTSASCAGTGMSNTIGVHVNTGVTSVNNLNSLTLFPNPNTGSFQVFGSLDHVNAGDVVMDVLNDLGQVVYSSTAAITRSQVNAAINLEAQPAGIYLLRLTYNGETKVTRFTIDK